MTNAMQLQHANQLLSQGQYHAALAAYLPLLWYLPALRQATWQNIRLAASMLPVPECAIRIKVQPASNQNIDVAECALAPSVLQKYLPESLPFTPETHFTCPQPAEPELLLTKLCNWVAFNPSKLLIISSSEKEAALLAFLHQLCWQSHIWWHLPAALNQVKHDPGTHWHFSNGWLLSSDKLLGAQPLVIRTLRKPFDAFFAASLQQLFTASSQANLLQFNELLSLFSFSTCKPNLLPPVIASVPVAPLTKPSEPPTKGSGYRFELDRASHTQISGWAVDMADPDRIFEISVELNGHKLLITRNDRQRNDLVRQGISNGLGGFHIQLPACLTASKSYTALVRMPDGSVSKPITFSPLDNSQIPLIRLPKTYFRSAITIIMPVFNALADVKRGLAKLQAHTSGKVRLVIINDASTDPAVKPYLDSLSLPNLTVLHNDKNLGFSATVNKGIVWAGSDDVVLLNSDARVTPNWLTLLQDAAYSNDNVATVTPFSDRAGAFSAPTSGNNNTVPFGVSEDEFALAVQRNSSYLYPVVPTGNGFCMYIKRSCLDAIGLLDAEAFPRGYGEENDFCMRAQRQGWYHIIADSCYVFHERSQSFGEEKHALMQAGRAVVDSRYPEYTLAIQVFRENPVLALARFKVFEVTQQILTPSLPRVLFVVSTQTGGTPQTNNDLMQALQADIDCWLLRCDSKQLWLWQRVGTELVLRANHTLTETVNAITHRSNEYDSVLTQWLQHCRFTLVHIRHLVWHSLNLPKLAKHSGAAVVMSLHDYYSLCPTIQLLDNNGVYCQANCTKSEGDCKQVLWPGSSLPPLKNAWVSQWQQQFNEAFAACDIFITTSASAKQTLQSKLPITQQKPFYVIGHGRDFEQYYQLAAAYRATEALRIVVPGNIADPKGLKLIQQVLQLDTEGLLEFHILGQHKFNQPHPRLVLHGAYKRDDFASHIERIAPHIGAVWSIWNETWCHTLTELWACGVPVAVLPYDTVATRVKQSGAGWILPQDAGQLYQALKQLIANADDLKVKSRACHTWQLTEARYNNNAFMASAYQVAYQQALAIHQQQHRVFSTAGTVETAARCLQQHRVALVCPAKDREQANPSTHVRLWQHKRFNLQEHQVYPRLTASELLQAVAAGRITQAIIQRQAIPAELWPQLKTLVEQGKLHYQLDLDDNLLKVPAAKDTEGFYQQYRPVLQALLQHANQVTVASSGLQQQLTEQGVTATLVTNVLSNKLWRASAKLHWQPSRSVLYMGSPSHDDDFELIAPALAQVAALYPDFRLVVIGVFANQPALPTWVNAISIPTEAGHYPAFVKWYLNLQHGCCAAIAPLQETYFNAGKSPLKVLDYAAIGLPVLASAHTVYQAIAQAAPAVTLVENTSSAWFNALVQLLAEPAALAQQSTAMQQWVFNDYCK